MGFAANKRIRYMKPALGIVEMLIALAITAMLLSSVAVAFHVSLNTIDENQKVASATQNGRVVLNRMLTEARRADDVSITTGKVSILPPLDASGIILTVYELKNGTLWYRQTKAGVQSSYAVLAPSDGVQINSFSANCVMGKDSDGNTCATSITARLDLQIGNNRFAVTASTNPRRNMTW